MAARFLQYPVVARISMALVVACAVSVLRQAETNSGIATFPLLQRTIDEDPQRWFGVVAGELVRFFAANRMQLRAGFLLEIYVPAVLEVINQLAHGNPAVVNLRAELTANGELVENMGARLRNMALGLGNGAIGGGINGG